MKSWETDLVEFSDPQVQEWLSEYASPLLCMKYARKYKIGGLYKEPSMESLWGTAESGTRRGSSAHVGTNPLLFLGVKVIPTPSALRLWSYQKEALILYFMISETIRDYYILDNEVEKKFSKFDKL